MKRYAVILICSIFFALILLMGVRLIPEDKLYVHVYQSSLLLEEEGNKPELFSPFWKLDNFTDAIMLNIAIANDSSDILTETLLDKEIIFGDLNSVKPINRIKIFTEAKINGENVNYQYYQYGRYWHGYLITLKPLLLFFQLKHIRIINAGFIFLLFFISFIGIKKSLPPIYNILYISLFILFFLPIGPFSLQYSSCFIILMAGVIAITYFKSLRRPGKIELVFYLVGILTSFFDFLTVPLLPLCILIIIYAGFKNKFSSVEMIKMTLIWGAGYFLFWASKWVLVSIFTDQNMMTDVWHQFIIRSYDMAEGQKLVPELSTSYYKIFIAFFSIISFIVLSYLAFISISKKESNANSRKYLLYLSLYPLIWFFFAKNHSVFHIYMTYRLWGTMFFALGLYLYDVIKEYGKNRRFNPLSQ